MYRNFYKAGQKVEHAFAQLAEQRGWSTRMVPAHLDAKQHWDVEISQPHQKLLVDVKGMKKICRRDASPQDKWIWLEVCGVADDGWLYAGHADLIAFETKEGFILAERPVLIDLVELLVPPKSSFVKHPWEAEYRLYNREGRKDILTMVEASCVRKSSWSFWEK